MNINSKSRPELKNFFKKNAIPTESNFADFIDAGLNQKDDGLLKPAGEPLSLEASLGTAKTAIRFYETFAGNTNPSWVVSLADPVSQQPAFVLSDGPGNTRLSIGQTGAVSAPGALTVGSLTSAGAITAGAITAASIATTGTASTGALTVASLVATTTVAAGGLLSANAGANVTGAPLNVGTSAGNAQPLNVWGALTAKGTANITGLLTATGGISTTNAISTGTLAATGMIDASGGLTVPSGKTLTVNGTLSAGPTTTGALTATGAFNANGGISIPGSFGISVGGAVSAGSLAVGTIAATGSIDANGGLTVAAGRTLTVNGTLNATNSINANGGLTIPNGVDFTVGGKITASGLDVSGDGISLGPAPRVGVRLDKNAGQYLSAPTIPASVPFNNGFTVQAWIYLDSLDDNARVIDFGNVNGTLVTDNITFFIYADGSLGGQVSKGSTAGPGVKSTAGILSLFTWTHVALTVDNTGIMKLYKNGTEVGSTAASSANVPNAIQRTVNWLGRNQTSNTVYWNGILTLISVWTGVRAVNMSNLAGNEAGLIAFWGYGAADFCSNTGHIGSLTLNNNARNGTAFDRGDAVRIIQEDWATPPLLNNWTISATVLNPPGYFKDSLGIVHLRGVLAPGAAGTAIFNLPNNYRPAYNERHVVSINTSTVGHVDVAPGGNVTPYFSGTPAWVSLDGITFRNYQ
jgi:concanavalin A-like lectin/glucanase superfamily protein